MVRSPIVIDLDELTKGVLAGDRATLGRAITLVESSRPDHRDLAEELLHRLAPQSGRAHRVGVTGVPGVGKSTFIDTLGSSLTGAGRRVAVLAVDPSSSRSGGSILGDKTRMERLSVDDRAFIRPSPTSGTLGGVTRSTRQTIVVVEAAGYDVVLVETVGVGQSEIAVASMVDSFLVLTLARTGDSLQAMKRGVLELADVIAVNKADGSHQAEAERAAGELSDVLRLMAEERAAWSPPVLTCSGLSGWNLDRVWAEVERHRATLSESGELAQKRRRQQVEWMWSMVYERVLERFRSDPAVRRHVETLERGVREGEITPTLAALRLLEAANPPAPP